MPSRKDPSISSMEKVITIYPVQLYSVLSVQYIKTEVLTHNLYLTTKGKCQYFGCHADNYLANSFKKDGISVAHRTHVTP